MATTEGSEINPVNHGNHSDDESAMQLQPTKCELFVDYEVSGTKKRRKFRSNIWKEFHLLPSEPGEALFCACNKCGHKYSVESRHGTSNLHRHLKSCHKEMTTEIENFNLTSENGVLPTQNSDFDQDKFKELVVHAILRHDLPFSYVEYEGVRDLFNYLEPQTPNFTRDTVESCIKEMYDKEMTRLRDELIACPSRISLTCDIWTSIITDEYLSVTAHYVDSDWVLRKKILSFSYFPPPHSGMAMAEKITNLVTHWGIEKKLFSITLDNGSINDSCVGILKNDLVAKKFLLHDGLLFHAQCCAQVLNSIVQDGLKEIDDVVIKIRECVKYIKGSKERRITFNQCVVQSSLESQRGLQQDVPTHWNSTYMMLSSALYYRPAFYLFYASDNSNHESCPTQNEWERVEKICEFLELFYEATTSSFGSHSPTSNQYFFNMFLIQLHLIEKCKSSDDYTKKIAQQMFTKFNKYWSDFNLLLAIAVVFDPQYKLAVLDFSYSKLYGRESLQFSQAKSTLFTLFEEYMQTSNSVDTRSCSRGNNELHSMRHVDKDSIQSKIFAEFEEYKRSVFGGNTQKTQLERYLDEPRLNGTTSIDVLEFWKSVQYTYPKLAKLARDILSVPISTVASVSAFSFAGRTLDQYRSSMTPTTMEAFICTRDWLFGEAVVPELKLDEIILNAMASYSDEETNLSGDEDTYSNATYSDEETYLSGDEDTYSNAT